MLEGKELTEGPRWRRGSLAHFQIAKQGVGARGKSECKERLWKRLVPSFALVVSWTQLGGGTCTERKRVQEAYGWVEHHPSAAI